MKRPSLTRYAWLSITAALLTIALKTGAYLLSGSVGLLSDAMESGVNLIAAGVALVALIVAAQPPDEGHNYGHDKAEFFSSGVEGGLILVASVSIIYSAITRLLDPQPLEKVGISLIIALVASALNFAVARILLKAGAQNSSIVLEADAHHLMTDVWTSVGVVAGVGAVLLTGWTWLDPVIALLVALNILRTGFILIRRSVAGLMDASISPEAMIQVKSILDSYQERGVRWHALRTRHAGSQDFMEVHILVPGGWTVQAGHDLLEMLEADLRKDIPSIIVTTHLEPIGDVLAESDADLLPVRDTAS